MQMTVNIVAVARASRFSPNSEQKDMLILQRVGECLRKALPDSTLAWVNETDQALESQQGDIFLSMARSTEALRILRKKEDEGSLVVNSAEGVERCQRSLLERLMREEHFAMPPVEGPDGYWLKRGDAAAQSKDDIVFCPDHRALEAARQQFVSRGITNVVVSAHVVGDLIKFYGVGSRMFRYFYPSEDGISKFGDEKHNGKAHHYPFSASGLRDEVTRLAGRVGVSLYGGDAIIDKAGNYYIIDFNDWPSFSRCREEAARDGAEEIFRIFEKSNQ